jgi:hypothetical protein
MGFGLVNRFTEHSQVVTTNNYNTLKITVTAVGIATSYGLDDQGVGVRVPVRARILYMHTYTFH